MTTLRKVFCVLLFAAATAAAAVDPALLALVMPGAKVLSGIQVDQAIASPFGQYVLSQMQNSDKGLDQFVAVTGFDPRRDLREVLVASDGTRNTGLVLGRGTFDPAKITAAAKSSGAITEEYKGVTLVRGEGKSSNGVVAFLDNSTAVMGDRDSVVAAIDRRGGAGPSADLSAKANAASANNQAWFVTLAPLTEFLAGKVKDPNLNSAMQGNMLQAIQQASGGIRFGGADVTISGEAVTRSEKDASALVDVMKFLAGLVQLNRDQNPGAAKAATLLDTAKFSFDGNVFHLSMVIPEDQVEKLFMSHKPAKVAEKQ